MKKICKLKLGILLIGVLATACKSKSTNSFYPEESAPQPMEMEFIAPLPPLNGTISENDQSIIEQLMLDHPEELASFPGGNAAMMKYISDNFRHTEETDGEYAQGRVTLQFIVRSTGEIENIIVVRSVASQLDKEVVRIFQSMPLWIPAKKDGKPIDTTYTIPVSIRQE